MAAVEQAKINMTVEQHTPVAAALSKPTNKVQQQITELTVQVAALSSQQSIVGHQQLWILELYSKWCFL